MCVNRISRYSESGENTLLIAEQARSTSASAERVVLQCVVAVVKLVLACVSSLARAVLGYLHLCMHANRRATLCMSIRIHISVGSVLCAQRQHGTTCQFLSYQ